MRPLAVRNLARLLLLAVAVATLLAALPQLRRLVLAADAALLHEGLKDLRTRLFYDEEWALTPLPQPADYDWLDAAGRPPRIAHALGASSTDDANTLHAFDKALRAGLRVQELDLWLDDDDRLRCHHGPAAPPPWRAGECSFELALARAVAGDAYLVLDLKSDFERTGERVLAAIPDDAAARRVVLQLYAPAHAALYAEWWHRRALAGPIVTAYRARRAIDHVVAGAAAAGMRVVALPASRLVALTDRPSGLQFFVHPVHSCATLEAVQAGSRDGAFVLSGLVCQGEARQ